MPTIPTFIGRFKIVSQIGKGGMGALYLAWDPTLEREIAIKLLREDNDDLRERFAREARSVARLRHPHIVTVFDVGVHEDQPFIAMEYIKGQTLAEIIGSGAPLNIVRKLQLAEELCDGLAFAHKAGIVHRDVKPANIIVDESEGSLKLLDFGIARVGPGMTQAGMLIGTLNYMSPEQVVGGAVDGRSDIFAVGTVLYELLARRQAFPGRLDTGILHKILHVSPEPLDVLCRDLDPEIIQIVNRALEKDPAARYQELTAMRRDLQRILRRLETLPPADELSDDDATILMLEARPQTPTPRTPKGTDRDALERRRASQIQAFLEAAGKALEAGDYEAVIERCEEVLLLDSNNAPSLDLLDRAKVALDERQADAWLDEARQRLEQGELTTAADLAHKGLRLNPAAAGGPSLVRRIEEARQERERAQERIEVCRSAVSRARDWLARGYFEDAAAAADQALAIDPAYPGALAVKQEAEEAAAAEAKRRDLENQRAKETLDDAHRLAQSGDADAALRLLENFSPPHPEITTARETLRSEIEARRRVEERRRAEERRAEAERQERERRARAAMDQANGAMDRRDFAGALEILRALQKSDPDAAGLQALIADAETRRLAAERARQIAIEIRGHLDAASERLAAEDFNAAVAHVQRALALDPDHQEAQSIASRIDDGVRAAAERREQEARRQREREQALVEAMARAESATTHDAAIAALRDALAVDPDHQPARRLLSEHETAVDVERRLAAALARARDASSTEAAVAALRQAIQIAPAHAEARRLLHEREEDLAREQAEARRLRERQEAEARQLRERQEAEARKLRERQEAIAAAIRTAAAATSHAAALAALRTALDIDPNHPEARRLFDTREAALKHEQAVERRRREIDAACHEIDAQINSGALDAAERGIAALEREPDAKKAVKPLRKRLKQARAAAGRAGEAATVVVVRPQTTAGESAGAASPPPLSEHRAYSGATVGARSPLVYVGAAVAVLMLLVIGYVLFDRQPTPRPVVTDGLPAAPPASTEARPPAGGAQPSAPAEPPPDGRAQGPADAVPSPAPALPVPETPAAAKNQGPSIETQVAPLRRLARQQFVAGAHPQALATAMSGLRLAPKDSDLLRVVNDISTSARASAQRARQAAQAAGPAAVASAAFKDAVARQDLAARLARNRQVEPSLKAYLEAAGLFTAAAAEGRRSATADPRPSPTPPASSAPPAGVPAGVTATPAPGVAVAAPPRPTPPADPPPPAIDRPAPAPAPSVPAAAAQPPQTPPQPAQTPPPVAQGANDENLIRSTLQAYAQALSALDPAAVLRVYPSLDGTALTRNFEQMRSQRIQIENAQISVTGTTATVTCQVRNHFEPKAGRASDSVGPATFRLQKTGAGWVIVQRGR